MFLLCENLNKNMVIFCVSYIFMKHFKYFYNDNDLLTLLTLSQVVRILGTWSI